MFPSRPDPERGKTDKLFFQKQIKDRKNGRRTKQKA